MQQRLSKLGTWVDGNPKQASKEYKVRQEQKTSPMTLSQIQSLEHLGVKWCVDGATWEDRLSELTDYRKIHGALQHS
jgi:outer membrane biogenesis lipoprotein LolB